MRQDYIDSMGEGIRDNFQWLAESLEDARNLVDVGEIHLASLELREMIDVVIQTIEVMSALELLESDLLMGAINLEK